MGSGKARGARKVGDDIPQAGRVLSIVGILFVAICFVLCVVSYCAPFWVRHRTEYFQQGLWGKCFFDEDKAGRDGCRWVWQFYWALENSLPVWFKSVQVLFSIAVLTVLITFFIACMNLFCRVGYYSTTIYIVNGSLMTLVFVLSGISLLVFGLEAYFDDDYKASVNSAVMNFDWAFYVGICGWIMSCFSAVVYFVAHCTVVQDRRRQDLDRYRQGYEYSTVTARS